MKEFINKVHCGKVREFLSKLPDNSIDSCITDPQYGLKFKGHKWDYELPSVDDFKEIYRVLKPGSTMLCFGGTRTFHRLAVNVEDAGFFIMDTIFWIHGQGFPKSVDIAYAIDKKRDKWGVVYATHEANNIMGNENDLVTFNAREPFDDISKRWFGWGTALKPACEPILVCRKPIEGNYEDNAVNWGVAGYWIDGTRIGNEIFGVERTAKGRWPSNVILDEETSYLIDEQTGNKVSNFFYCPKPTKKEKGQYNNHSTVKPVALMSYLCRLTKTPDGGIVLDPFCGSGTTALGAIEAGRDFIISDMVKEYCEISEKRIYERLHG